MKKRLLALLLTVCMVLSLAPAVAATEADSVTAEPVEETVPAVTEEISAEAPAEADIDLPAAAQSDLTGLGTAESPFLITSIEDLKAFRDAVNGGTSYEGQFVRLTADIDLNNEAWTPIGTASTPFLGSFDGNDCTISNLTVSSDMHAAGNAGLFGYIGTWSKAAGTIIGITLENVTVACTATSAGNVGALAGVAHADIYDIQVRNATISGRVEVGGLVGNATTGSIHHCSVINTTITGGYGRVGGITGQGYCEIDDCYVDVDLTAAWAAGGIIGLCNTCKITNNYVTGTLTADKDYGEDYKIGGIVGTLNESNNQTITNNYCDATVTNFEHSTVKYFPIIGMYNVGNTTAENMVDLSGNSWNRDIFDTDSLDLVGLDSDTTVVRDNNLIAIESDLEYIDATSMDDVTILDYSDNVPEFTPVDTDTVTALVLENSYVAEIDGVKYDSLQKAIDAAEAGDTVKLTKDFTVSAPVIIAADDDIVLDLNGFTVSKTMTETAVTADHLIRNLSNLTIMDSSENKDGKLLYTYAGEKVAQTVSTISNQPGGSVTVLSGTVENATAADNGSYAYAIDSLTNGSGGAVSVTVNGGTVTSTYMGIRQFVNSDTDNNSLTVTGGIIYGGKRGINIHNKTNDTCVLTISGGSVTGSDYSLCALTESSNLSVTGGTFDGDVWYSGTTGFITGGTFSTDVTGYCAAGYKAYENSNKTYTVKKKPAGCAYEDDCASKTFTDVPAYGNWAHAGIDYVVNNGLMNGTSATKFAPEGTVTRAQIVTILYRLAGSPDVSGKNPFVDATASWYQDAIIWAVENGITAGTSATTFAPDKPCTREQVAVFLFRYTKLDGTADARTDLSQYPDNGSVSSFAKDAMSWAVAEGLINGTTVNGQICLQPQGTATRAQIATIIMRFAQ